MVNWLNGRNEEVKKKISLKVKQLWKEGVFDLNNEKNGMWKGFKVGLSGLHFWISKHKSKPLFCECCKKNKPYDLSNISGKYKRDVNDFEWLCRKCHMLKDGRMYNLRNQSIKHKLQLAEIQANNLMQELNLGGLK